MIFLNRKTIMEYKTYLLGVDYTVLDDEGEPSVSGVTTITIKAPNETAAKKTAQSFCEDRNALLNNVVIMPEAV